MKAETVTTDAVEATLQKLFKAYKERNLDVVMECFVPDNDLMLIGTGSDEKRVGPGEVQKQVERDWDSTESVEMSFISMTVSAAGSVAWVFADGSFKFMVNGQAMVLPVRASFILEDRDGQWLIVHAHFSTPAAGQQEGSSV